ncbi:hypothetical protein M3Y97_00193400 [Aphelenchoides bicaudatus]|nr:hypothetical protein M3Y97_00193400 [Aphelenchoides bicaudatus]
MSDEWKPDFTSFWRFYDSVKEWQENQMQTTSEQALNDFYENEYDQMSISQEDIDAIDNTTNLIRVQSQEFVDEYLESNSYDSMADEAEEFEATLGEHEHIMGNEEDWTPEMAEFVRKTREHRQQLAEARAKAEPAQKKKEDNDWVEKDLDDFVLAEEIGVHGVSKPTTSAPTHNQDEAKRKAQMQDLYGSSYEKVAQLEAQLNNRFETLYKELDPNLWPNIPMKL